MARPNKRTRIARARTNQNKRVDTSLNKLISQYERELKSTQFASETERLTNEIARLRKLIETRRDKKKLKATSIISERPNIGTSLTKKKGKMRSWVSVYQGGATGLKK